jgi:multiple sugar transport system ATP-binding protein
MAAIAFEDVTKVFRDGTTAVSGLDLEIPDGEFIVLVGPSGCGKTTALRMVAGLEDVTSGTIRIGDRIVNRLPPQRRELAMVFQNYALYPHLTVRKNMAFGLALRHRPKREIDRKVVETARLLGLEEFLDRKPRELSGGQRQRVAMGRAIVREPQAFLMDEPLSNLDAKLRVQMRAEITALQRELRVTTLYVTHDQTEAMTMADRVAVLRKGHLQQVDEPETVYAQPVNLFVAGFIGSPAMNIVEAELTRDDQGVIASFGSHRLRVDDEILAERPALRSSLDRSVVLGIRPESFDVADGGAPADRRLSVRCDLREALGPEVLLHFTVEAPPVLTDEVRELAADVGADVLQELEERTRTARSKFVARVAPDSRVREGDQVELVCDTRRLHFFDAETNLAIYDDTA